MLGKVSNKMIDLVGLKIEKKYHSNFMSTKASKLDNYSANF